VLQGASLVVPASVGGGLKPSSPHVGFAPIRHYLVGVTPIHRPGNGLSIIHVQLDFTSSIYLDLDLIGSWISLDKRNRIIQLVLDLSPGLNKSTTSRKVLPPAMAPSLPASSAPPRRQRCRPPGRPRPSPPRHSSSPTTPPPLSTRAPARGHPVAGRDALARAVAAALQLARWLHRSSWSAPKPPSPPVVVGAPLAASPSRRAHSCSAGHRLTTLCHSHPTLELFRRRPRQVDPAVLIPGWAIRAALAPGSSSLLLCLRLPVVKLKQKKTWMYWMDLDVRLYIRIGLDGVCM
jgi:hypothetical protein